MRSPSRAPHKLGIDRLLEGQKSSSKKRGEQRLYTKNRIGMPRSLGGLGLIRSRECIVGRILKKDLSEMPWKTASTSRPSSNIIITSREMNLYKGWTCFVFLPCACKHVLS